MEFLATTMLWGALAAGLPVLIHLAGRAKPVAHRFPAMRFLQRSQRASSRALRLKHLLLLLLRAGIIALLAFTFARPLFPWRSAASKGVLVGDIVIVIDASLSMQYCELEQVRFEAARTAALTVMDALAEEARVALIRAGDEPDAVQGRLTLDHETVRMQLRDMRVTASGLDVGASLDAARRILERDAGGRSKAVILITDVQASGFDRIAHRVAIEEQAARPPLIVVDVGQTDVRNGAVLSLRLPGATVPSEDNVRLNARVRPVNPQRACPVDLYLDGVKVGQQSVEPAGADEVDVQFSFPAGRPGVHGGWLQLAHSDGLMADQRRYFTYRAGPPPRVLLVQARDGAQDRGSGFFLKAVLSSPAAVAATGLSLQAQDAATLTSEMLAGQRCVVLADSGALTESVWRSLSTFAEEGGGLLVWLGPRSDQAAVRRFGFSDVARHYGLLPGRIEERTALGEGAPVRLLASDHPLLVGFPASVTAMWSDVRVRSMARIVPDPRDKAVNVLLEVPGGGPLLLEKTYGRGRVFLSAVGAADEDSDLVKHGEVFVTLVLETCRLLAHQDVETTLSVGSPLVRTLQEPPKDGSVNWFRPAMKEAMKVALEAPLDSNEGKPVPPNRLVTPRLIEPGIHRFEWQTPGGTTRDLLVAVNVPARESDPTRLDLSRLPDVLSPWPVTTVREISEAPLFHDQSSGRREFSALLLLLILALMMAEAFLANRLYPPAEPEQAGALDGEVDPTSPGSSTQ